MPRTAYISDLAAIQANQRWTHARPDTRGRRRRRGSARPEANSAWQTGYSRARHGAIRRRLGHGNWILIVGTLGAILSLALSACQTGATRRAGAHAAAPDAYVLASGQISAYNVTTGQQLWQFAPSQPSAISSMVLRQNVLYIGDGSLFALHADNGTVIWQVPLGGGTFVSPISLEEDKVIIESSGVVYAVHTSDGSLAWSQQVGVGLNALATTRDAVYAGAGTDGGITALTLSDGSLRWHASTGTDAVYALRTAGDQLFASTTANRLLVFDTADGSERWTFDDPTVQVLSQPLVGGNAIYLAAQATVSSADAATGGLSVRIRETVIAVRARDGEVLWHKSFLLGPATRPLTGPAAVLLGGRTAQIVVATGPTSGDLAALSAASGVLEWRLPGSETVSALSTGEGGVVYRAGSSGTIAAVRTVDGVMAWRTGVVADHGPVQSIAEVGGVVFAATSDGSCEALDARTGRPRWHSKASSGGQASLTGAAPAPITVLVSTIPTVSA